MLGMKENRAKLRSCSVQLWDNSNIEIIQRFRNEYLRIIVNAPCYVSNDTLHHDLSVPYVRDVIKKSEIRRQIGETR